MTSTVTQIRIRENAVPDLDQPEGVSRDRAGQIARAVTLITGLPEGDALVPVLGDGTERSNIAALATWVQQTYPAVVSLSPADQVTALAARLRAHVEGWLSESFG